MRKIIGTLLTAGLFAFAGTATEPAESKSTPSTKTSNLSKPLDPGFQVGSVKVGDTTIHFRPGGKAESITRSGNLIIYQKDGKSTFSVSPKKSTPQFIHDYTGKVVNVTGPVQTPKPAAKPAAVPEAAAPSVRVERPSPIVRPASPSFSSMPSSPFLRSNPGRK